MMYLGGCAGCWLLLLFTMLSLCDAGSVESSPTRRLLVFVALADNDHQGIVPVPEAIGNGGDPERNLYWGAAEGLKGVFDRSKAWELVDAQEKGESGDILNVREYRHRGTGARLLARAYRGCAIRQCIEDFETALKQPEAELIVFIGHNGLMDFELPAPDKRNGTEIGPDCAVLCCRSEAYFRRRIEMMGARPILLTTQLMYPGAFILEAVAERWLKGEDIGAIRDAAGRAYARNQRISLKAATGVFSDLE